jgi:hypothetical protein
MKDNREQGCTAVNIIAWFLKLWYASHCSVVHWLSNKKIEV